MNKMLFTYLLVDWYEMNLYRCYDCVYDFRNESMFIIFFCYCLTGDLHIREGLSVKVEATG